MPTRARSRYQEVDMDRRHTTPKDVVLVVTLIINFSSLVWGAATMSSTVTQLKESVNRLNTATEEFNRQMSAVREDFGARLRVLESKVLIIETAK